MKVIKIRAKVLEESEDEMELKHLDLGTMQRSDRRWVWRKMGIELWQIYRIIEYKNNRSIIIMNLSDEEKILVDENFESLFARWEEMKKDIPEPEPYIGEEHHEEDEEEN